MAAPPTALDLLWGTRDRPRRGPRPSLSLDRIVAEAISLADEEGLANLSMQRLAERLGCAKMALYRYVPGKSELVALMVDAALGDPPEPPQRRRRRRLPDARLRRAAMANRATAVGDDHQRPLPPAPVGNRRDRGRAAHRPARDGLDGNRARGPGRHRPDRPRATRRGGAAQRPRAQPGPGDPGRPARSRGGDGAPDRRAPWPPAPTATRRSWRPSRNLRRPPDATTPSTSVSTASSTASPPSSPPARPDPSQNGRAAPNPTDPSQTASCYSK